MKPARSIGVAVGTFCPTRPDVIDLPGLPGDRARPRPWALTGNHGRPRPPRFLAPQRKP
jgi:hypothetical protein